MSNKYNLTGLTNKQVSKQKGLGLSNETIDSYSPSVATIVRRNYINLINAILGPLALSLAYFQLWREVLVFFSFILLNSAFGVWDQLRVKRRLDALKEEFQRTADVIRDGEIITIAADQVVQGDFVIAQEGEGVIADGIVQYEDFLQIDQSMLTGESDYIRMKKGNDVLSGSFVVTGEVVYEVQNVGKQNYLNRLGAEATSFKQTNSQIQKIGNFLAALLALIGFSAALINFLTTQGLGFEDETRLLAITSILALIIPQSLIFLFTLTFSVSVTRLSNKGILIQKKGSIDELATIDILCMDKTGTITTNDMKLRDKKYWNMEEKEIGGFYKAVENTIVGRNKTQEVLERNFNSYQEEKVRDFEQVPFTSKQKYSVIQGEVGDRFKRIIFGAPSVLDKYIDAKIRAEVMQFIKENEDKGRRTILGLYSQYNNKPSLSTFKKTDNVMVFVIQETLNPGIKQVLEEITAQGIELKVISGDSKKSVQTIAEKVGIKGNKVVDLSKTRMSVEEMANDKQVFTRARPEDKLAIIKALQEEGHKVAMVGDGVNDVLSMKRADVGISMESGSKITRDIADIVLLKNDYKKIPEVFFEGNNIIFNLRLASKVYVVKSIMTFVFVLFVSFLPRVPLPLFPTSTLIFSFFASTVPSYVISLTREVVTNTGSFLHDVFEKTVPIGILFGLLLSYLYIIGNSGGLDNDNLELNTMMTMGFLAFNLLFAMYTFWETKKFTIIPALIAIYVIGIVGGAIFTFLPLIAYPIGAELFQVAGVTIGGLLFLFFVIQFVLAKMQPKLKFTSWIILFGGLGLATFFPVSGYYAIDPIPFYFYAQIQFTALIAFIAIVMQKPLTQWMFAKKNIAR